MSRQIKRIYYIINFMRITICQKAINYPPTNSHMW